MSLEAASLVISIDSTGAKTATVDMDKLTASSERLEAAQEKVTQSAARTTAGYTGVSQAAATATAASTARVSALQMEYDLLGKTRSETERYLARAEGLPAAAQREAEAIGRKIDEYHRLEQVSKDLAQSQDKASSAADKFIASLKAQTETAGLSRKELLAYQAAQLGLTDQAAPLIAGLNESGHAMEGFSLKSSIAKRELMVMSRELGRGDFTRLGSSFSIFAQSSGLMALAMTPLGIAIGAVAVAAGAAAFAFHQGGAESKALNDALLMTGDYAGKTGGQMSDMAEAVSKTIGTHHQAAAALTELTASGKIAGDSMGAFAATAIAMEKATGQAISKTVDNFVKLSEEPTKASAKLNETLNYLTATTYAQITALEEMGKKDEAAALAQKTYSDAMKSRADTVIQNLGYVERAFNSVISTAKRGWDAMLGLGREASLQDKLNKVGAEIEKGRAAFNPSAFGDGNSEARAKLQTNLALQASLQEMERLEKRGAEAAGARAQAQEAGIKAVTGISKLTDQNATSQERMNKELRDNKNLYDNLRKAVADSNTPDAERSAAIKLLADEENQVKRTTERYAEKSKATSAKGQDDRAGLLAAAMTNEKAAFDQEVEIYTSREKMLKEYHTKLGLSDADFYAGSANARADYLTAKEASYAREVALVQAFVSKNPAEVAANQTKLNALFRDLQKFRMNLTELASLDSVGQIAGSKKAYEAEALAIEKAGDSELKKLDATIAKQKEHNAEIGKTKTQIDLIRAAQEDALAKEVEGRAAADRDALDSNGVLSESGRALYEQDLAYLDKIIERRKTLAAGQREAAVLDAAAAVEKQQLRLLESVDKTAQKVFVDVAENGSNAFKKIGQTLKSAVLDLLYQMTIKKWIIGIAGSITGAGAGTIAAAQGLGAGSLLTGASNANSLSSLYSAGTGYSNGVNSLAGYLGAGQTAGASAASLGYANVVGAVGGDGFGALVAANNSWAGIAASASAAETASAAIAANTALAAGEGVALAAGTGAAAAGGTAAAGGAAAGTAGLAAIPVYGWIALAAIAAFAIFSKESKPTASRGDATVRYDGAGNEIERQALGTYGYSAARSGMADAIVKGLQTDYAKTATSLGIKPGQATFGYASNTGEGGEKKNFDISGQAGDSIYRNGETAESPEAVSLAASRAVFAALKGSELPKYLKGVFDSIDPAKLDQGQVTAVLERAKALKTFNDQLLKMPFANLAELSYTATQGLMAAVGGFDALQSKLGSYFQNYYSQEEQRAQAIKSINEATAGSGLDAATATRASFRALVEAQDVTTDSGLRTYAALLNVADAFAAMTPAADAATTAITANAEAIKAGAQAYRDKFFSDAEKAASATAMVGSQFAAIGQSVPSSRAAFRSLVEAQDLNTTAGKTLRDALMALAPAFDAATSAADQAAQAMMDARTNLLRSRLDTVTAAASGAYETLSRAIKAQQDRDNAAYEAQKAIAAAAFTSQAAVMQSSIDGVKASLDAVGQSIGKLKSLSSSLKSTLDGMRIIGSEQTYRTGAQAQISGALATAKAGGGLPLGGEIENALRTVSKPSEQLFASFEDYARDFYKTANDIAALSDITDAQLSADEITQGILREQADALNEQQKRLKDGFAAQVSSLDKILDNAKRQLDAANGINTSVLSVADALAAFNASILALTAERAKQDLPTSRGIEYTPEQIVSAVKTSLQQGFSVNDIYQGAAQNLGLGASKITDATDPYGVAGFTKAAVLPDQKKYSDQQVMDAIKSSLAAGFSIDDVYLGAAKNFGISSAEVARIGKMGNIPGFAAGGAFGGGARIVGERGPELEVTGPSRIYSADQTRSMIGGDTKKLEALIEKLTEKVASMESHAKATAGSTQKLASQFDTATEGGRAILTEVYA